MSSGINRTGDVADDAARSRKMLAKKEAHKLSGVVSGNTQLAQGNHQKLGEHAVLETVTSTTHHQITICRPIGVTDLPTDCWVALETSNVPGTLDRQKDPSEGEIFQARAKMRTDLAIECGLLHKGAGDDHNGVFYPGRMDMTRNAVLDYLDGKVKERKAELRSQIDTETDPQQKGRLKSALKGKECSRESYMDEATYTAEVELREFYRSQEVVELVESAYPQTYRTLTGTFGDQQQTMITGSQGKTLNAVMDGISRQLVRGPVAGGSPPGGHGVDPGVDPDQEEEVGTTPGSGNAKEGQGDHSGSATQTANVRSLVSSFASRFKTKAKDPQRGRQDGGSGEEGAG